jgi:hypothetical protein
MKYQRAQTIMLSDLDEVDKKKDANRNSSDNIDIQTVDACGGMSKYFTGFVGRKLDKKDQMLLKGFWDKRATRLLVPNRDSSGQALDLNEINIKTVAGEQALNSNRMALVESNYEISQENIE